VLHSIHKSSPMAAWDIEVYILYTHFRILPVVGHPATFCLIFDEYTVNLNTYFVTQLVISE